MQLSKVADQRLAVYDQRPAAVAQLPAFILEHPPMPSRPLWNLW
jgi:hypothetical protein